MFFGTRPEAIKMAPLIKAFERQSRHKITICVTAQHRQMLDDVLSVFQIIPDFDLDIMQSHQTLSQMTCSMLPRMTDVLLSVKPDMVMVHGDVTTGFVGALASFYQQIPVIHIEAGLRTYHPYSPFPEEMNRSLISRLATYHFAPTFKAANCLRQENIPADHIVMTGNTVIDSLYWIQEKTNQDKALQQQIAQAFEFIDFSRKIILVTGHRRENWEFGLKNMCETLKKFDDREDCQIIYAMHPNPRTQKIVQDALGACRHIFLIPPLSYPHFVFLMQKSFVIVTDSGGIQEEAPAFGVPILLTRNQTERQEGVDAGYVTIVGNEGDLLSEKLQFLLEQDVNMKQALPSSTLYGDGKACERIIHFLDKITGYE